MQKLQKWDRALEKWEELLDETEDQLSILQNKAVCLIQLELYSEAEEIYKSILKNEPSSKFALIGMARISEYKGNLGEARKRWSLIANELSEEDAIKGQAQLLQKQISGKKH